jgi:hypothetical protein
MRLRKLHTVVGTLAMLSASAAHAVPVLTNYPTGTVVSGNTVTTDFLEAKGFTTGPEPSSLDSIKVRLQGADFFANEQDAGVVAGLYSASGGSPGTLIVNFLPVTIPFDLPSSDQTLVPFDPTTLEANTSYFIRLGAARPESAFLWNMNASNNGYTTAEGVTFTGSRTSMDGGTSWLDSGANNLLTISASAVPEPASLGLLAAAGSTLLLRRRRRSSST